MSARLYLALDQGGHASRAIVFDSHGTALAQAYAPVATLRPAEDRVEHDPEQICDSLRTAIDDVAERISVRGEIVAAGLATQRSSIVCWDRSTGAPLSPVISWQDRRNAAFVAELRPRAAEIHARTGLVLSPHYGASKLRWCLDNLSAVAQAARDGRLAFGPLSSFILFQMLERRPFVVDPANASRTQLFNPATRNWSPELLKLFGIDVACLPDVVATRHDFGKLHVNGREIPLNICTGDQSTVPFAFGPAREDTAYVNLGTGAFIQCPISKSVIAPRLLTSVVWADPERVIYTLEGTVNGAGSALDWFGDAEGVAAERMLAALDPRVSSELKPPLFLNGISGLGSPFWVPDFQSRYVGEGLTEENFLAVLESILFLIRVNLDEMRLAGAAPARVIVTGGLAASDWLCQRLADLVSLPVHRHDDREATARGLAYLVAGQPEQWQVAGAARVFETGMDPRLLERFFAWLKEMKRAVAAAAP